MCKDKTNLQVVSRLHEYHAGIRPPLLHCLLLQSLFCQRLFGTFILVYLYTYLLIGRCVRVRTVRETVESRATLYPTIISLSHTSVSLHISVALPLSLSLSRVAP